MITTETGKEEMEHRRFLGGEIIQCDTVVVDTLNHAFVKIYKTVKKKKKRSLNENDGLLLPTLPNAFFISLLIR